MPFDPARFGVDYPRARRLLLALAVAGLAGYALWSDEALTTLALAAVGGAAAAVLASRADRSIARDPARARRWTNRLLLVGGIASAVGSIVLSDALAPVVCAFLGGFLAPAAFLYPLRARPARPTGE